MALVFEISASVTLVGDDLQFAGKADDKRVHFIVANEALKRLAGSWRDLTRQEKFKAYDRNKQILQEAARRLWEAPTAKGKRIKIGIADL